MYNGLVERCFANCVHSFQTKTLSSKEEQVLDYVLDRVIQRALSIAMPLTPYISEEYYTPCISVRARADNRGRIQMMNLSVSRHGTSWGRIDGSA